MLAYSAVWMDAPQCYKKNAKNNTYGELAYAQPTTMKVKLQMKVLASGSHKVVYDSLVGMCTQCSQRAMCCQAVSINMDLQRNAVKPVVLE